MYRKVSLPEVAITRSMFDLNQLKSSDVEIEETKQEVFRIRPKRRILLVDDSTYNLYVMQELLNELSDLYRLEVVTALNGELAVQAVLA